MKHLPYIAITAFLLAAVLFVCSCSGGNKLSKEDKEKGVIMKGKKHVLTLGNKHKFHYYYKPKN